jgi:hypothetical protein
MEPFWNNQKDLFSHSFFLPLFFCHRDIFLKFCLADLSIAERKLTIAFNDIIAWAIGYFSAMSPSSFFKNSAK